MSSTSNKNTPGNYKLEQSSNNQFTDHMTFINSAPAEAFTNHFAGDGLLMGKNAREHLCNNYCDVESQLRGIGSTNLVTPKKEVLPELKYVQSLSISDRLPTIVPEPLKIDKDQRPFPTP
jgi:hypothetical protein